MVTEFFSSVKWKFTEIRRTCWAGLTWFIKSIADVDGVLLLTLTLILSFGFVFNISANGAAADPMHEVKTQAIYILISVAACIVVSRLKVEYFCNRRWVMIAGCAAAIVLLLIVYIKNKGLPEPDRDLKIPIVRLNFQPSEFAKLMVIMLGAFLYNKYYHDAVNRSVFTTGPLWSVNRRIVDFYIAHLATKKITDYNQVNRRFYLIKKSWAPAWMLLAFAGACAILVSNNHLSGLIIIVLLAVAMCYFGRLHLRWFIIGILLVSVVAGGVCVYINNDIKERNIAYAGFAAVEEEYNDGKATLSRKDGRKLSYDECMNRADVIEVYFNHMLNFPVVKDYQIKRIYLWLDKDYNDYINDSSSNDRQQINRALYAVASGGIIGKGPGNSISKYWSISAQANDEIFAVICEEVGMLGAIAFILLYLLLIFRCLQISDSAQSVYSSLVAKGVATHIGLQVFLHIFVTLDIMPNTGISLPFVSSGGSSMLFLLIEMGVVFSIARYDCPKMTDRDIIDEEKRKHGKIEY